MGYTKKQSTAIRLVFLACLLAALLLLNLFAPNLYAFNLSYKNDEQIQAIPTEILPDAAAFESTLPLIYLRSYEMDKLFPEWHWSPDGPSMPLREESKVDLYVFDRGCNHLTDVPTHVYTNSYMKLRGRTSSYMQQKKPFSLAFRDAETHRSVNMKLLSLPPASDFVFHAPYIDRSLIRNYVAYQLQHQLLDWAPDCQFAEVFVSPYDANVDMNHYIGVYLIVEKIKAGKNALPLKDYIIDPIDQFAGGGNFIYKRDAYEGGYDTAIRLPPTDSGNAYSLVYPKDITPRLPADMPAEERADALTQQQLVIDSIANELSVYDKALYEGTDLELARYYDLHQFARCMLIDELLKNMEGFTSSMYFYRAKGEQIKPIQWDFDIGTGNFDYQEDLSNAHGFYILAQPETLAFTQHENFREILIEEWRTLRADGAPLSDSALLALLDGAEQQLEGAWQRNDDAYRPYDVSVFMNAETIPFTDSAQERIYIRNFLLERGKWLDEHIHEVGALCEAELAG